MKQNAAQQEVYAGPQQSGSIDQLYYRLYSVIYVFNKDFPWGKMYITSYRKNPVGLGNQDSQGALYPTICTMQCNNYKFYLTTE